MSILPFLELRELYKISWTHIKLYNASFRCYCPRKHRWCLVHVLFVHSYYIMLSVVLHIQHLAEYFEKALEQKRESTQNDHMVLQIKQLGGPTPTQPPIDKGTCWYCKQKEHGKRLFRLTKENPKPNKNDIPHLDQWGYSEEGQTRPISCLTLQHSKRINCEYRWPAPSIPSRSECCSTLNPDTSAQPLPRSKPETRWTGSRYFK